MKLNINNETSRLESVIIGIADDFGGTPIISEAYDPKSIKHIREGTYPKEESMVGELKTVNDILKNYYVRVYHPTNLKNVNQIFTRDVGFVIEDKFIKSNMISNRTDELLGIEFLIEKIYPENIITIDSPDIKIEGGDIILYEDHIFIGTYKGKDFKNCITARTNQNAVLFIRELFPQKIVKEIDLNKSMTNSKKNALHLDCCFQPVSNNKAIIHKEVFRNESDYQYLVELFGIENLFHIDSNEMLEMYTNILSIDKNVVISDKKFTRLNNWFRKLDIVVEEVCYSEIGKQNGLIRCSTLPLCRN
ncbi:dimethylarginine dimethylaminohydrolase family protein [Aquimarina sp. RZ0]|uniref:dimethylarginine dimethylaminohydrolase family protein n=1 Tax=Aquimarina sp. RZ0 TaxID=2607730 RepID=UPI0011F13D67|nr:arginine deiminase family protein [Aquimarina sp. RZ0]KAA1243400.1 amidinotransferase [Aquimarina sp. RZ0]